jgi:hypothetical protein
MSGGDDQIDSLFFRLRLWTIEGTRYHSNRQLGRSTRIPNMAGRYRSTTPAESAILEPVCRHTFSFPARTRERQACVEERHLFLLSRLEPHPKGQIGRAVLLVGRTHLPLPIVPDPSVRAFMRESAAECPNPSVAELRNAVLRIAHQFRPERGRFCDLTIDAATSGAESGSASAC